MAKKKKLTTLKKKCWKLFSEYIRRKYADENGMVECVTCQEGKKHWKELQAGHFIDSRCNSILFDERGVYPQCFVCNFHKSGNKVEYFRFMQKAQGDKVIDELRRQKHDTLKYTVYDYEKLIGYYRQKLEELNAQKK